MTTMCVLQSHAMTGGTPAFLAMVLCHHPGPHSKLSFTQTSSEIGKASAALGADLLKCTRRLLQASGSCAGYSLRHVHSVELLELHTLAAVGALLQCLDGGADALLTKHVPA
jgi:hypothetical protein